MKFLNKIRELLTFARLSEIPTFRSTTDFGFQDGDRFTFTRGGISSKLTVDWKNLVAFLELEDIRRGTPKFREVLNGSPFVSDGHLMTITKVDAPA